MLLKKKKKYSICLWDIIHFSEEARNCRIIFLDDEGNGRVNAVSPRLLSLRGT